MKSHPSQEELIDYLHGELAPGTDAEVLLHLDGCAQCREGYQDEVALSESLRDFARETEREFPAGIRAYVLDAIQPRPRRRFGWWALPAAAALLVAGIVGYDVSLHSAVTIDAAYYLDDHAAVASDVPFNEGNTVPAALFRTENADGAQ
ncbi:MAG TPA: anti-sigma factor [Candidatus Acidoferrales bacterium]|nr:anti-sigma factor [Candidatus Acidoferrales bacterium]